MGSCEGKVLRGERRKERGEIIIYDENMVTIEQIKELEKRLEALRRYL